MEDSMKHVGLIFSEFVKIAKSASPWWKGKKFRHPKTSNFVVFKSLPPDEQRRLNALHKEKSKKKEERLARRKARLERRKERAKLRAEKRKLRAEKKKERARKLKEKANIKPDTHPTYFTQDGKRLYTHHGYRTDVALNLNPEWDSSTDNTHYATQVIGKSKKSGNPIKQYYYTENYIKKHQKAKFANNIRFHEILPQIREKIKTDLTSEEPRRKVYATAIALVDQAAMRIGNKKSEKNDVYGLHNLNVKHLKLDGNNIELTYTGKDEQPQHHSFKVSDVIRSNIAELIAGKNADDPIFTWKKKDQSLRITPRLVNRYLKQELGSNVTVHHFRHHHGSLMAQKYLNDIDPTKMSKKQIKGSVREACEYVSEYLGNTANVAKRHYIDPAIFQKFYKRANMTTTKKAASSVAEVNRIAAKPEKEFRFVVSDDFTGTTPDENEFYESMITTKLEDLIPYEDVDFESMDFESSKE
jgi:DNA topoisomerase IB